MLSREQTLVELDFARRRVIPDRLTRKAHAGYVEHARRMIEVYQQGAGKTRQELHRAIEQVFAEQEDCPARRIAAFCKLLDNHSRFRQGRIDAARLRRTVFRRAAAFHPLVANSDRLFGTAREKIQAEIANELGRTWKEIEQDLFADVIEYHRLEAYEGSSQPEDLLARYNVAQAQAALYDAVDLVVWCEQDFRQVLRAAKLAGLMHHIVRQPDGIYCFRFNGPASLLRETRRYGTAMAKFLPALIACHDWKLVAKIKAKSTKRPMQLHLNSAEGLRSDVQPEQLFDSEVESRFAEKWGASDREGWRLIREGRVLHQGQTVFTPDFVLQRHGDTSQEICVEIVGFWTEEYLQEKLKRLSQFTTQPSILLVQENRRETLESLTEHAHYRVLSYKTSIRVEPLLETARELLSQQR